MLLESWWKILVQFNIDIFWHLSVDTLFKTSHALFQHSYSQQLSFSVRKERVGQELRSARRMGRREMEEWSWRFCGKLRWPPSQSRGRTPWSTCKGICRQMDYSGLQFSQKSFFRRKVLFRQKTNNILERKRLSDSHFINKQKNNNLDCKWGAVFRYYWGSQGVHLL